MAFASIYVPDFPVQAVVRSEPSLRRRAVALTEGIPPFVKVTATNAAARNAGVIPGMPESQAAEFDGIEIRRRNPAQERAAHAALLDLGWSFSPRVEDTAPDTVVLDLAGLASLFGSAEQIAGQLARRAADFGLTAHVAVASNVEAAILAARGFPGITMIPEGQESNRLGSLPIEALSPSPETQEALDRWGVRTCAALAALPLLDLSERLGPEGVRLHELARGAHVRPLRPAAPALGFEEEMPLDSAVAELEPLAFLLRRLLGQLCGRLAARALAAGELRVRLHLEPASEADAPLRNGVRLPRQKTAPRVYEKLLRLPLPLRDPGLLLNLLRLQLQADPPPAPVWRIALTAEPARPRATQKGLFLPSSPDPEKLELTIARLANLVGDSHVGSPQLTDTHRPGDFSMSRFPAPDDSPSARQPARSSAPLVSPSGRGEALARKPVTGFRLFRPPLPARVRLCEGRPTRVWIRGRSGRVVAASGPWRTSGDWWREAPWRHDEWDLEIRFDVPAGGESSETGSPTLVCRLYYDEGCKEWFVRGSYD